jgi:polysaccharide export outer membrane protein
MVSKRLRSPLPLILICCAVSIHAQTSVDSYPVGPKDVLSVSVYGHPELSGKFPVDATGDLSLPLVGSVRVAVLWVSRI